jgi:hypothetical protein
MPPYRVEAPILGFFRKNKFHHEWAWLRQSDKVDWIERKSPLA